MPRSPAEVDTVKVLIAEDDAGARVALAQLIESEASLTLVGQAKDADQAIHLAAVHRPDVALVDVRMPLGGGARATREIRLCSPDTKVLALSFHEDRGTVLEMIRAGAEGYLVKGGSPREIIDAIHSSARGGSRLSDRVTREVVQELAGQLKRQEEASVRDQVRAERMRLLVHGIGVRLAFQPIVDLAYSRILGLEALARFPETVRSPSEWLAEAEDLGMRTALELTILKAILARVPDLPPGVFLAINLSPVTLASTPLLPIMKRAPMDRIVFEITEHAPVGDYKGLNEALAGPRERGVRIAIDDAGAGFASLRHVVRLSPEFIKLDRALIVDIDSDPSQRALASALIAFAEQTGATIVAEGIETQPQLDTLRELGVSMGQGFYLAPPGPLSTVTAAGDRISPPSTIG
jgi:EAL domain-containing protein (putative c-di-GMP-specific phosphodiesterase class I)/CheY-like chemotaxis protein